jgi:hypothetical protein
MVNGTTPFPPGPLANPPVPAPPPVHHAGYYQPQPVQQVGYPAAVPSYWYQR